MPTSQWVHLLRLGLNILVVVTLATTTWVHVNGQKSRYFVIHVIDEQTGRGVPLVKLKFLNEVTYWTDSGGYCQVNS